MTRASRALAGNRLDYSATGEALRVLLDGSARMGMELVALEGVRDRARLDGYTALMGQTDTVLRAAGDALRALAERVVAERRDAGAGEHVPPMPTARELRRLAGAEADAARRRLAQAAAADTDRLTRQLRTSFDTAGDLAGRRTVETGVRDTGVRALGRMWKARPRALRLREPLATLRANLTLRSTACRHALRLAACLAVADAVARGFGMDWNYWVPLTVAIVLKPDFSATFSRGVGRVAGTLVGLVVTSGLVYLLVGSTA